MKQNKTEWIIGIVFAIIGIGVLVFGIYLHIENTEFMKTAIKTEAVIDSVTSHLDSDNERVYEVYVSYNVDEKIYGGVLGTWHSGMYEGQMVDIYYSPINPANFKNSSSSYVGLIVCAFGGVFALAGTGLTIHLIKRKRMYKNLMASGQRIVATIDGVNLNTNYTVNGRNPYVLNCSYTEPTTNKVYTFVSDNIWFNIQKIVEVNDLKTVSVYMDLQNPKKYIVDIKELQQYIGNQI